MFQPEVDWTITLSRNDFPWHEIKFDQFSAKDCFDKYSSIVKDPFIFLKKVLGDKEKYKKMMQSQLNNSQQILIPLSNTTNDNHLYCTCKGAVVSEFYVKCDGEQECPYLGWFHP
jgi:hypothetical protein